VNRYLAKTVREAVAKCLGYNPANIEVGRRESAPGIVTYDCRQWPDDSDLEQTWPLGQSLKMEPPAPGVVWDLYVWNRRELDTNLDCEVLPDGRVNGFDPFAPGGKGLLSWKDRNHGPHQ